MFIVFLKEFARKFFEKSLINDVNQGYVCEHNMFYGIFNGFSRFITFLLSFVVFVSCFSFASHLIETFIIILFLFSVASFSKNSYICIILCRNCFNEAIEASLRVPIFSPHYYNITELSHLINKNHGLHSTIVVCNPWRFFVSLNEPSCSFK